MTYNGWTNYETWVVKRWLGNDESTVKLQRELLNLARGQRAARCRVTIWGSLLEQARPGSVQHELADLLAEWVKEVGAMKPYYQEANFSEIAESIITGSNQLMERWELIQMQRRPASLTRIGNKYREDQK